MRYLLVLVGGGLGSLARFVAATAVMNRFPSRFPLGTTTVNITGSFLIGLLITLFTERFPGGENWRPLLVIGFLGGYTTFSSLEWETFSGIRGGAMGIAFANLIGSVILGYAAVWLGVIVARK